MQNLGVETYAVHSNGKISVIGKSGKNQNILIYNYNSRKLCKILKGGT
jgi:hypothetical protein